MVPNNQPQLVVLEVTLVGSGKTARDDARERPIVAWEIEDGSAHPVILGTPAPGAHLLILDKQSKTYYSAEGAPFQDYKAAMAPFWALHDAKPSESAPPLTAPAIGGVAGGVNGWVPRPAHHHRTQDPPRDGRPVDDDFQ